MDNGYNPIRWRCQSNGCYLTECHPKIEVFADCFPNRIAMSDIDGVVEINGHFIFMEWKGHGGKLTDGQKTLINRMTALSEKVIFFVVYGDSKTMEVTEFYRYHKDKRYHYKAGLDVLKEHFEIWAKAVK